jgi:hypothetical protein
MTWSTWYPRSPSTPLKGAPTFEYLMAIDPPHRNGHNVHIIKCRRVLYAVVVLYNERWEMQRHEREFLRTEEAEAKTWCEVMVRML